jgi:hypothetical protein
MFRVECVPDFRNNILYVPYLISFHNENVINYYQLIRIELSLMILLED